MSSFNQKLESFFLKRKAMIVTLVGSLLLLLVAYNFAGWVFLTQFEENLDHELGRRLQAVAGVVSKLLERDLPQNEIVGELPQSPGALLLYRVTLNEIRNENQLQAIYIVTPDYRTIISEPEGNFETGDMIAYLREDSTEFIAALNDSAAFSRLHEIAGNKFKSGYAPIKNLVGEVIAVVVIEASANFFSILDKFQNGLFLGIFLSVIVILLYGVFIAWAVTYFVRLQESARQNERLAVMGQMAATVAHEIRNPLGIIKSTAEVLRDLVSPNGKQKELLEFIPSEVDRLNRLVSDFLTFARDKKLNLERQNIVETIGKAVSDIQQEFKNSAVEIACSVETEEILVEHAPDGIRQVVLNLVMNSIQAMNNSGSVKIEIAKNIKRGKKFVQIGVVDNGPGIDGRPDKVFEPFFTTKTSGSGLGLSVTKQIIEKHGGTMEAVNLASGGLGVYFSLPL